MAQKKDEDAPMPGLDAGDLKLLTTYGASFPSEASPPFPQRRSSPPSPARSFPLPLRAGVGPYTRAIKQLEKDIQGEMKKISDLIGAARARLISSQPRRPR
jgi:hypothetical protein